MERNIKPGLALDIDETLAWTLGLVVEKAFKLFGNPENLTVKELIKKYRYTRNIPYWQTKEIRAWFESQWNSDELQVSIPLVPGAKEYVEKIGITLPIKAYLTVRPNKVINGTRQWLEKNGFPDVEIITKPDNVEKIDGNKWKAEVLNSMYPEIVGLVDDNMGILEFLPKSYKGNIFIFDFEGDVGRNFGRGENVYACKDWESVYKKVQDLYVER